MGQRSLNTEEHVWAVELLADESQTKVKKTKEKTPDHWHQADLRSSYKIVIFLNVFYEELMFELFKGQPWIISKPYASQQQTWLAVGVSVQFWHFSQQLITFSIVFYLFSLISKIYIFGSWFWFFRLFIIQRAVQFPLWLLWESRAGCLTGLSSADVNFIFSFGRLLLCCCCCFIFGQRREWANSEHQGWCFSSGLDSSGSLHLFNLFPWFTVSHADAPLTRLKQADDKPAADRLIKEMWTRGKNVFSCDEPTTSSHMRQLVQSVS